MKKKINEIADVSLGAPITRISKRYDGVKEEREVLYCKVDELYTKKEKIAVDIDEKYLTKNGDVIFKLTSPQTAICINESNKISEGVVVSSKFVIIKPQNVDSVFLAELLNSNIAKNQFYKFSEGIIKQIKIKDLEKIEFEIPSLEEQKKCVKSIKLINKEINIEEQLIEENKNLKEVLIRKTQGVN